MKYLIKKIYIILFFLIILLNITKVFAKDNNIQYKKENIENYFLGKLYINKGYNDKAFKHLKKVQFIKNKHNKFNTEYIRTLVLLEKFEEAFTFSKSVWNEDELFFEIDLLLGLNSFIKEDYKNAEKHFQRLNKISRHNLIFDNFIGNVLIAWIKASQGNKEDSFKAFEKVPRVYNHLKSTQNIFLQCYFNENKTQDSLIKLTKNKDYNFSRYNFFLINYLISQNKISEAKKIIQYSRKRDNSNILLKQTESFLLNNETRKIKNFFSCKDPKDPIAEFFYVISNLYSSEKDYRLSNFYLKISLFLNNKFLTNRSLLAENFYYQNKIKESKNIYYSLKKIGATYSWYASKNIASILEIEEGKKSSIYSLEKDFNLLPNQSYEHYYELANFYKNKEYYKESIKYYSLVLKKIPKNHFLISKVLYRRGTSFERLGDWDSAEKDLIESLKILPDQAHVLNYLAYTWVDRGINLDKGLVMLKKANELSKNDPYIIDSLGWVYHAKKNYNEANSFLQKAIELLPYDPVINDHYGDNLWKLNKNIQARYIWSNILKFDDTEQELKNSVKKKLIFGITRQL